MNLYKILLFLSCVLVLFSNVKGVIESRSVKVQKGFSTFSSMFQPFHFQSGGYFNLTLSNIRYKLMDRPPRLLVQLCGKKEIQMLPVKGYDSCDGKAFQGTYSCVHSGVATDNMFQLNGTIETPDFYTLIFYSCSEDDSLLFQLDLIEMNHGSHLGTNEYNLLKSTVFILLFWGFLALCWSLNFAINIKQPKIKINLFIFVMIVVKIISLGISALNLFDLMQNGRFNSMFLMGGIFFDFLFLFVFFCAILSFSKGWCVIKSSLDSIEIRNILILSLLSSLAASVYEMFQTYMIITVIVVYVLILKSSLGGATTVLGIIDSQLAYSRRIEGFPEVFIQSLSKKREMVSIFQKCISIFTLTQIILMASIKFLLPNQGWLSLTCIEAYDACIGLTLLILLRLRNFSDYYRVVNSQPTLNFVAVTNPSKPHLQLGAYISSNTK